MPLIVFRLQTAQAEGTELIWLGDQIRRRNGLQCRTLLFGTAVQDTVSGTAVQDTVFGTAVQDTVFGAAVQDTVFGTEVTGRCVWDCSAGHCV